jgi:hypothetical protein
MTTIRRMSAVVSLTVLALAAALAPAAAQSDTQHQRHGRWHGAASAGSAYGHARYRSWPYKPGQNRVDEGPGFYQGYGANSHNVCFPGESMYDGC